MGRGTWGQLRPFVISCHCFVLPSVRSQLSPGEGKAEQRDSAGGLLRPLILRTGDVATGTAFRDSQDVEILTKCSPSPGV